MTMMIFMMAGDEPKSQEYKWMDGGAIGDSEDEDDDIYDGRI